MTRPTGLLPGSPLSGTALVGNVNDWLEALAGLFTDPTAPTFSIDQMLWQDNSVTPPVLKQRRGGVWEPFGFGGFQRNPPVIDTDWNSVGTEGLSIFTSDAAANRPTTGSGWVCLQLQRAGGAKVQLALRAAGDDMRIRRFTSGTWTQWWRMFGDHNLLGTVSQASGVPTGAVIESGSNANGLWTKWADGTMICRTPTAGLSQGASIANGALFSSASNTPWTYPQAFAAVPVLAGHFDTPSKLSWLVPDSPSATSVALRGLSLQSWTSGTMYAQATGRWF